MTITTNDGAIIAIIEDIDQYDLTKPLAQQSLLYEIKDAIDAGRRDCRED